MQSSIRQAFACGTSSAFVGVCAGMFLEEGLEHWELVNRINYLGVVYTLKAIMPDMVQRNSGRIIVTNSSGSFMGGQGPASNGNESAF